MQKCKKHKKYKSTKVQKYKNKIKHLGTSYQYKKAKQSKTAKVQNRKVQIFKKCKKMQSVKKVQK